MNVKKTLLSLLAAATLAASGCGGSGGSGVGSASGAGPSADEIRKQAEAAQLSQYTQQIQKNQDGIDIFAVMTADELKAKLALVDKAQLDNRFVKASELLTDGMDEELTKVYFARGTDGTDLVKYITLNSLLNSDRITTEMATSTYIILNTATQPPLNTPPSIAGQFSGSAVVDKDTKEILLNAFDKENDTLSIALLNNDPTKLALAFDYDSATGNIRVKYKALSDGNATASLQAYDGKDVTGKTLNFTLYAAPAITLGTMDDFKYLGQGSGAFDFLATGDVTLTNSDPAGLTIGYAQDKNDSHLYHATWTPRTAGTHEAILTANVEGYTLDKILKVAGVMRQSMYGEIATVNDAGTNYNGVKTTVTENQYQGLLKGVPGVPTNAEFKNGLPIADTDSVNIINNNYNGMSLEDRTAISNPAENGELLDRFTDSDPTNGTMTMWTFFMSYLN